MALRLYNTLSRQVEDFVPASPEQVTIYTCGPTVYGNPHIGNHRTYVAEDILVKTLRRLGFGVKRVMNITDVGHLTDDADSGDDKMEVGARREGMTAWDVAKKYEAVFLDDLNQLRIEIPQPLVRATDTISQQISLIQTLESKGYTYTTSDGVYFDSSKLEDYGKLARLDVSGLQAGSRVDVGQKLRATDFALWKFSPEGKKRDMEWDSPWGKGFPGWHVECSAIIQTTLGDTIDIHCGGVDHIPVHHTNEIAQSEAATGHTLSRYWFHTDFLLVDGGKMSKSLGNLFTLSDITEARIDPAALRLFFYSASYRSKLNFTWDGLHAANRLLRRLRFAYHTEGKGTNEDWQPYANAFNAALSDDLNTAAALATVWQTLDAPLTQSARQAYLENIDEVLSLGLAEKPHQVEVPEEIQSLLAARATARADKDWNAADRLRSQIEAAGFQVQDTQAGTEIY